MPPHSDLARLSPVHIEAALLYAQGYTQIQIAERLEMTQASLSYWWRSPLFKEKVEEFQREMFAESLKYATQKMGIMQAKAVDRLEHLMEHAHSEAVQLGAVREVLERGPLKVQRSQEGQKVSTSAVILSPDMIFAMKRVAEMTGDHHLLESIEPLLSEPSPPDEPGIADAPTD